MFIIKKFKLLNKKSKVLRYMLAFILFYALVGFLLLPIILKPILIDSVSEKLSRKVQLQSLKINPFTLSVTLNKFSITGKQHSNKQDERFR